MTLVESMGVLTYEMRYLVSENWERVPSSQAELLFAIIGMVNCLGLGFCGKPALVFFWWPFAASRQPCPYERGIPNLRPQTKRCCSNFFRIRIFLGSVYLASFFPQMVRLPTPEVWWPLPVEVHHGFGFGIQMPGFIFFNWWWQSTAGLH